MKNKTFLIIFSAVIVLSLSVIFVSRRAGADRKTANIYQDGALIETVDLSAVTAPYELEVNDGELKNTVLIEHGSISMKTANCPDQLCVRQGAIRNGVYPIVCLPHKVIIEIVDSGEQTDIDAISGRGNSE